MQGKRRASNCLMDSSIYPLPPSSLCKCRVQQENHEAWINFRESSAFKFSLDYLQTVESPCSVRPSLKPPHHCPLPSVTSHFYCRARSFFGDSALLQRSLSYYGVRTAVEGNVRMEGGGREGGRLTKHHRSFRSGMSACGVQSYFWNL